MLANFGYISHPLMVEAGGGGGIGRMKLHHTKWAHRVPIVCRMDFDSKPKDEHCS